MRINKRAVSKTVAVAIVAIIVVAAVAVGVYYLTLPPPVPVPENIKVGAVLPITGAFAREGEYFKTSYELATAEVNEAGGIFIKEFGKKIPVKLIILDDENDKDKSVRLLEHLITVEKVDVLLGGYSTSLVYAQETVVEKEKIPYINAGGASTEIYLTEEGKRKSEWFFGLLATVKDMGRTTMDFLKYWIDQGLYPKPSKIALVWQNTAHGRDYQKGVHEKVKEYPGYFEILLDESFEYGAVDYTPLLLKVKAANADIFLSDSHLPHYLTMHRQYIELGMYGTHIMVSHGARGPEKAARDEFKEKADYLISCAWWTDRLPYPQVKPFVEKWAKVSKLPAGEWYSAFSYDCARTLYKAIEAAGSLNKEKVREALQKISWTGALVPGEKVYFNEFGLLPHQYVMTQNLPDFKLAIVWPTEAAEIKPYLIPAKS